MERTIRLEVKTGGGEVESLVLATITRPAAVAAAAEVGLRLAEGKALLAELQAAMVRRQRDCREAGGQAAMAACGWWSLAAWKRCPKPVPSVPL